MLIILPQKVASFLYNPGREETRMFLRRNVTFELKTNFGLFSHTRATQS